MADEASTLRSVALSCPWSELEAELASLNKLLDSTLTLLRGYCWYDVSGLHIYSDETLQRLCHEERARVADLEKPFEWCSPPESIGTVGAPITYYRKGVLTDALTAGLLASNHGDRFPSPWSVPPDFLTVAHAVVFLCGVVMDAFAVWHLAGIHLDPAIGAERIRAALKKYEGRPAPWTELLPLPPEMLIVLEALETQYLPQAINRYCAWYARHQQSAEETAPGGDMTAAKEKKRRTDPAPVPVQHHGGKSYSIVGQSPIVVSRAQDDILQEFAAAGAALDTKALERVVANVARVIAQINKKLPGAVCLPKDRGQGYYIHVLPHTPQ